jgi:hypothetical protein
MAKILIGSELGSYSFNKVAKTITFAGFTANLERLLLITDVTNNTIIYQFNDPTLGGTLSNNVLTLTYNTNTGSFANTDKLQIFYWSEEPQQTALFDLAMSIKRDLQMIRRDPMQSATGIPVTVSSGTIGTVTTVSAVSFLNGLGLSTGEYYPPMQHQLVSRDTFNNWKNKLIS